MVGGRGARKLGARGGRTPDRCECCGTCCGTNSITGGGALLGMVKSRGRARGEAGADTERSAAMRFLWKRTARSSRPHWAIHESSRLYSRELRAEREVAPAPLPTEAMLFLVWGGEGGRDMEADEAAHVVSASESASSALCFSRCSRPRSSRNVLRSLRERELRLMALGLTKGARGRAIVLVVSMGAAAGFAMGFAAGEP